MSDNPNIAKKILLEFLDFLRYKIESDRMTFSDVDALSRVVVSNLELCGTAEDFARFYNKTVDSVRHILHRRVIDTPRRQVMHSFVKFRRQVPDSWRK